tara:strand:- start:4605 stop:5240 length:636 start_codon:yes stop_codon:yes gene_type:complete
MDAHSRELYEYDESDKSIDEYSNKSAEIDDIPNEGCNNDDNLKLNDVKDMKSLCIDLLSTTTNTFCRFLSPFSELDQYMSLFLLGIFTSGLFYGKTIFLHLSGISLIVALNICFEKYHADKTTIAFAMSCLYMWFTIAICVDFYPLSIIGACELGYSVQRSIARNAVDAESAAMIAISLNSVLANSYPNTVLILLYSIYRSFSKWCMILLE